MGFSFGQLFSQAADPSRSKLNLSTKISIGFSAVGVFVAVQLISTVNTGQTLVAGVEQIVKDSSPIKTACKDTAVGSATGASFLSNPFGIS